MPLPDSVGDPGTSEVVVDGGGLEDEGGVEGGGASTQYEKPVL